MLTTTLSIISRRWNQPFAQWTNGEINCGISMWCILLSHKKELMVQHGLSLKNIMKEAEHQRALTIR
jgi:hypothetical protein